MKEYARGPQSYDYLQPTLRQCLEVFSGSPELAKTSWDKIFIRHISTSAVLGPYAADLYVYQEMVPKVLKLKLEVRRNQEMLRLNGIKYDNLSEELIAQTIDIDVGDDLRMVDLILNDFAPFFAPLPDLYMAVPISVPEAWCSSKLLALVEIILEHYTATFQGIVFVEQRQVASTIAMILPRVPCLIDKVRCAHLLGNCGSNSEYGGTGQPKQIDIAKMFKAGELNLRQCWVITL